MISHDNVGFVCQVIRDDFKLSNKDRVVSYLPLSHIAAQMIDIFAAALLGMTVFFAFPDALKGPSLSPCERPTHRVRGRSARVRKDGGNGRCEAGDGVLAPAESGGVLPEKGTSSHEQLAVGRKTAESVFLQAGVQTAAEQSQARARTRRGETPVQCGCTD